MIFSFHNSSQLIPLIYVLLSLPAQADSLTQLYVSEAIREVNDKFTGEAEVVSVNRSFYDLPRLGVDSALTEIDLQITDKLTPPNLIRVRYDENRLKRSCEKIKMEDPIEIQNLRCTLLVTPKAIPLAGLTPTPVLGSRVTVSLRRIEKNVYEPIAENWFNYIFRSSDKPSFNLRLKGLVEEVFYGCVSDGDCGYKLQNVSIVAVQGSPPLPILKESKMRASIIDRAEKGNLVSIFCGVSEDSLNALANTTNNKAWLDCSLDGSSSYYIQNLMKEEVNKPAVFFRSKPLPAQCVVMSCIDLKYYSQPTGK